MQAFRVIENVADDGSITIKVPQSFGRRVEVIILPASSEKTEKHADFDPINSGFCEKMLGAEEEDVWNDL